MDLPGEKVLVNLIDKVHDLTKSGIGTVFRPVMKVLDAKADARAVEIARLSQERVRQIVKDVRAGRMLIASGFKVIDAETPQAEVNATAVSTVTQQLLASMSASGYRQADLIEIERQINLAQIAAFAEEDAQQDKDGTASGMDVDGDWFAQWRNRAQDVSKEKMQRLWAKVLKGKAKALNTFSIHTMDFLGRMSALEADLIAKLKPFAVDGCHVYRSTPAGAAEEVMRARGLDLGSLLA